MQKSKAKRVSLPVCCFLVITSMGMDGTTGQIEEVDG